MNIKKNNLNTTYGVQQTVEVKQAVLLSMAKLRI